MDLQNIETAAKLRRRIFLTAYSGGMAHLASSFSAVEILYALYLRGVMNHDPHDPAKPDRDRFVLSKGHGARALYAVLCEAGYLTEAELFTYLKPNCHIGGEPNTRDIAGIEASTGSLGHGMSAGVGMALAQKLDRTGGKTYVLIGDGESQEGSIWEAAMSAAALSLDNLIVILDCNSLQKSSRVDDTMGYVHWDEKWRAFGWNVSECDGHDVDALAATFRGIVPNGKPTLVIAHTVKGKGVSLMEGNPIWHFRMPNRKELRTFLQELQLSEADLEG